MPLAKYTNVVPQSNPIAPVCFAVSAVAFLASIVGMIVNHWLSGWMAVGGMACIGLFYLAIGLMSLGSRIAVYGATETAADNEFAPSIEEEASKLDGSPMCATSTNSAALVLKIRNVRAGKSPVTASDATP